MTAKELISPIRRRGRCLMDRLRNYLDSRSPRQRLWIVLAMLAAFTVVDICVIAWGIHRVPIEHIETFNP